MLQRVEEIISQKWLTLDDLTELSTILIKLSKLQYEYMTNSAELEHRYKKERADIIVEKIRDGLPYNKSEIMATKFVEDKYGSYRKIREQGRWYTSICNRVESFIKLAMYKNKIDIMSQDANAIF